MNFSILTETHLIERYENLPDKLSGMLFAEETAALVKKIAIAHHLDAERTFRLSQLIALVLMGFVSRGEITLQLTENLFLNYRHAGEIAEELNEKIFTPVARELDATYKPAEELKTTWEEKSRASFWGSREQKNGNTPHTQKEDATIHLATLEDIPEIAESAPLILHEEKKVVQEKPKFSFKGLSGFSFFDKSKKSAPESQGSVTVRVETPKEAPERVIHYNELHTPLTPFDTTKNFINLETFHAPNTESPVSTTQKAEAVVQKQEKEQKEPWSFNFKFFKPQTTPPLPKTPLATLTSPHTTTLQQNRLISETKEPTQSGNTLDLRT